MSKNSSNVLRAGRYILIVTVAVCAALSAAAQNVIPRQGQRIVVRGGVAETSAENRAGVNLGAMTPDSLYRYMAAIDSLRADGVRFNRAETDSLVTSLLDRTVPAGDSLDTQGMADLMASRKAMPLNQTTVRRFMDDHAFIARYIDGGADTLVSRFARVDSLSPRERRRLARASMERHNFLFRDSVRISRLMWMSVPVPGLSQIYNKQYWKVPVLYGTVAAGVGLYAWQNKLYKPYKRAYDHQIARLPTVKAAGGEAWERYKATVTELQGGMIRRNTGRQLAMGVAVASYMYFLVDGTLNYEGTVTPAKKATTLAMIFPGAGQIYNKTYWKLPIVYGGLGILTYVVNWNNRGYQRFKTAYAYRMDSDDTTVDEFVGTAYTEQDLLSLRNSYRRQRDLCLIFLGLYYALQAVDAHATAYMNDYDVSDDLTRVTVTPSMESLYTQRMGGEVNAIGFSLSVRF